MALVTVITPTYNRGENLKTLFQSLKDQTSKNFEWLIVDDGSVDNTREVVKEFLDHPSFEVRYIHKENGGKHTALNLGIQTISSELTFIVDSDDSVFPDGVETIERYYSKYKNVENLGALSFLRWNTRQGIMVKTPKDESVGSYVKERIKENRPGDMAEVFVTNVLKEFPFPEFEGERFLSEDVVWIPLGMKYKYVFVNKPIYQFEYLQDGLTRNDKHHKFASPLGSMMRGKMLMKRECGIRANLRGAIIYGCYRKDVLGKLPAGVELEGAWDMMLVFFMTPASIWFHRKWKNQAKR